MLTNRTQSRVSVSGLTYNNLIEDAYNAIKDSDEFKNTFSTFTSNEAARMIVELYAYVATQLANRMDQMGNELFVDTASPYGLSRLLKLVGAQADFPAAAYTEVTVSTTAETRPITFTTGIDNGSNELAFLPGSFKSVTANNGTAWEFIEHKVNEDGEYVYDYTTRYSFTAPSQTFIINEGTTHSYDYTVRSVNTDIITLPSNSVIKDSVRVYYKQKVLDSGTTNAYSIREFKKVDNFFTTDAMTADTGVFTTRNMGGGKCEICLKPYSNANNTENDIGKDLLIMYRTGGGADGNIAIGSIAKTERFNTLGENNVITGVGEMTITNVTTGGGGKNELTADEIRSIVINEVRNTKIAITEEDYEYLLPKYDSSIELLKCYGEKNDETADLAETYGYYVNPIAVWFIILKYNKEFYDAYMSGEAKLTDRINDIPFNTLDINPRFDEQYQVNTASINQIYRASELSNYYTESTRQYSFPLNQQGVNAISLGGATVTVTNAPYVDSSIESRKAQNYFNRYSGEADEITWEDLLALASVAEGKVYRVVDADPNNTLNARWRCKQSISSVITPEDYEDYWECLEFAYIYDNLVSSDVEHRDIMYIQQSSRDFTFTTEYSYLNSSFSALWDDLDGATGNNTMVVNGVTVNFDGRTFDSLQDLVDYINSKNTAYTHYVPLKENIAALGNDIDPSMAEIVSSSSYVAGTPEIVLKLDSETMSQNLQVSTSGVITYGDLVTALNSAIEANSSTSGKYQAVFNQNANNSCWDLWIICKEEFSFKDSSTSGTSAIYKYLLNHENYDGSEIYSAVTEVDVNQVEEWGDFVFNDSLVESEGDLLAVLFDESGRSTLSITGSDPDALRAAFGLSDGSVSEMTADNRSITVAYVSGESGNSANLIIRVASENDLLKDDIYINVFGGKAPDIILGSYYENIEEYASADTPQTIIDLLKRGPIKALYSTSYLPDTGTPTVDKYGCSYQLKFSTELVEEQTYNELSSGNSPAYVDTTRYSTDTMKFFDDDDYLFLRVDGMEYDGNGSFNMDEQEYQVPSYNGYAKFSLNWFNSHTVKNFVDAIVNTFETEGPDGEPALGSMLVERDHIRLFTESAAYYYTLDFGETLTETISDIFGVEESIVHSKEGQINVKQIQYPFYSLSSYPAIGKDMLITYIDNKGNVFERSVNVGYSITNFADNVNQAFSGDAGNKVVVNSNRLILTDLSNEARIRVDLIWTTQSEMETWKRMFSDTTWDEFIITYDEGEEYVKTTDTQINPGKTYYTEGDSYSEIEHPDSNANPSERGWYEIKEGEYVLTRDTVVIQGKTYYEKDYDEVGTPVQGDLGNYYERVTVQYKSGEAYCEFINDGDYYIELSSDDQGNNVYTLKVERPSNFPIGNIYAHMYEDYSYDHIISDNGDIITYTDEYNWNSLMKNRRVMLTEHIYKQPRFIPFDLALTCTLPNTEVFSQIDYNAELRQFLRNEYGIYSNNIGKEIRPDEIILNIKNSFSKILNITVDYLGYNMLSDITNMTKLETKFNQQHILASDNSSVETIVDSSTGLISFETVVKHGINLKFKYSG